MKKYLAFGIAALMSVTLGLSCYANNSFTASSGTCTVDGVRDTAYVSAGIPVNFAEDGNVGATAVAYAAWDSSYLYIYAEVTDAAVTPAADVTSIWSNDSVEFYVNLSGEEGAITDINAAQYTYGPNFTAFAGGGLHRENNVDSCLSAFTMTDTGYTVEVAIPWGGDYTPAENASFPFVMAVNDDSDGDASTREAQVMTGAGQTAAWSTADSNWDTLTLSGEKYVEIIEEAPAEEVPATEEAAPAQTNAAQTSDAVLASVALMSAVAAAAFVAKKIRK